MQGDYADALRYFVPVCGVTLICCHLAIRWAVYQFNQESVLFRESERLDLRRWLVHLVRDREDTPSLAEAFFCVVLIYVIQFFMQLAMAANAPANPDFSFLVTVDIRQPGGLHRAAGAADGDDVHRAAAENAAARSAAKPVDVRRGASCSPCCLHPFGVAVDRRGFRSCTRCRSDVKTELVSFDEIAANGALSVAALSALLAVLPALCEELAFRGFVLSGLRHLGSKWWAIGLSAVFFGMAHGIIQQSLSAAVLGMVIGYIAVQTGSLVPCMLFHVTYNALMFVGRHHRGESSTPQPVHEANVTLHWPLYRRQRRRSRLATRVAASIAVPGDARRTDRRARPASRITRLPASVCAARSSPGARTSRS